MTENTRFLKIPRLNLGWELGILSNEIVAKLWKDPLWRPEDLGRPIPESTHAISVAMPLWEHIVAYEEGDQALISKFATGYPRFVFHPLVQKLFRIAEEQFAGEGERCLCFPSKAAAQRCASFIEKEERVSVAVHSLSGNESLWAIVVPVGCFETGRLFWQHAGEIVSSRLAQAFLEKGDEDTDLARRAKKDVSEKIANLLDEAAEDVFLFPSGMAAIYFAHRIVSKLFPGKKTVQFGFPYVDILKVQEKCGEGVHFFAHGDEQELKELETLLEAGAVSAVFCEFPGNPLLRSIALPQLSQLLRKYHVPLLVDETIGTFFNVDLSSYADILLSSLTKFFSGAGDVAAGSLVICQQSPFCDLFREECKLEFEDLLWGCDAVRVAENSQDFCSSMKQINHNAERLCEFLREHPAVESVFYPKFETREHYDVVKRPGRGYGGLFSMVLKDGEKMAPIFYDLLEVCKGPSLGTNYTLACPYTLLAHYDELEWVASCGIASHLIRVSVGLEDVDDLIQRFTEALSRLP